MRIKPKEVSATVKLLRNPSPVAMALVDQGACQTPFNVVKRDKITTKSGAKTMSKRIKKGKGATRAPLISKMQFSKEQYPTAKDVTKYLTAKGVEGFGDVTDGDDVWIVATEEDLVDKTVGKARSTPGKDTGVTVFVMEAKGAASEDDDEEDEDEGEEDAAKRASKVKTVGGQKASATKTLRKPKRASSEDDDGDNEENDSETEDEDETTDSGEPALHVLAEKFDWYGAYMSNETTLVDVLKDGMSYDSMPPGMEEIFLAVSVTTGNVLADDDLNATQKKEVLQKMGGEFAEITVGLFELFQKSVDDAEKSVDADIRKSAKKFSKSFSESVAKARKAKLPTGKAVILEEDEEEDDDTSDKDDNVITGMFKQVTDQLSKMGKRVDALANRSTSRKSMTDSYEDLIDDTAEDEEEVNARKARVDDARMAFGGRPRSGS